MSLYDEFMPYLIDGNNLMPALADAGPEVGRERLCRLLLPLLDKGETAHVVFDGPPPPAGVSAQIEQTGVKVTYSLQQTADEVILKWIAHDSAPRRLTVVSTDKQIRQAAARRRCRVVTSQEFARKLLRIDAARHRLKTPPTAEARGKQKGLSEQETQRWLQEFGFEDEEEADRQE